MLTIYGGRFIMPVDIQDKIANLRLKIAEQEQEIIHLERECQELQADLADFEERYTQQIKPLEDQLEAAKKALDQMRELLLKQQMGDMATVESLWRDSSGQSERYIPPHERDFAIPEPISVPKQSPKNIKQLYRQLARQYHPDLASDEADRARRTKIMSLINNAYQEGDIESLQTLDEATPSEKSEVFDSQMPLDVMQLRALQARHHDLAVQIRDLKEQRHNLRYGHMMELKLEDSLAKARGEDMIATIIDEMQTEYWRYMHELDELREQVK
ncbi:MAG: J domain-containing protein [Chloroflexota bacterium]